MLLMEHVLSLRPQKSFLGLVQGASCRIDVDFKDNQGRPYKKTATVKLKTETEDLPLYTNKDDIFGEVRVRGPCREQRERHRSDHFVCGKLRVVVHHEPSLSPQLVIIVRLLALWPHADPSNAANDEKD